MFAIVVVMGACSLLNMMAVNSAKQRLLLIFSRSCTFLLEERKYQKAFLVR